MQVLVHKSDNHPKGSWNEVADLEILIPPEQNTADFVNDVLLPTISKTGFHAIGGEVRWEKNTQGQNVVRYFGATEGRTTLTKVIKRINSL
jgi:hypothetical protein